MDVKTLQRRTPGDAKPAGFGERMLQTDWTVRVAAIDGTRMLLEAGPRGAAAEWTFEAEQNPQTGRFTAWAEPDATTEVEITGLADEQNLIIQTLSAQRHREGQTDEIEYLAGAKTHSSPTLNERIVTIELPAQQ